MQNKKVLLIEDDPDSRSIYGTVLRTAGFAVLEARDGEEGVQLAQDHLPDLIVMDLGLPGVDGFTATETIRGSFPTSHIPVVVITVHVQDFYRGRAAAIGCDSFLEKPCRPDELLDEVARILNLRN